MKTLFAKNVKVALICLIFTLLYQLPAGPIQSSNIDFKLLDTPPAEYTVKSVRSDIIERVPILRAKLSGINQHDEVTISCKISNRASNSVIQTITVDHPIAPGSNKLMLDWNPMTFPERYELDNDIAHLNIQCSVMYKKKCLYKKCSSLTIHGIPSLRQQIDAHNQALTAETRKKLLKTGTLYSTVMHMTNNQGFTADKSHLFNVKQCGADIVDARLGWSELEPESGVFSWEIADRVVKWAEELGTPLIFHVCWSGSSLPSWLRTPAYLATINNGNTHFHDYPIPSHGSAAYKKAFFRMIKQVMNRYKNRNIIVGWQFDSGYNDMIYPDIPLWQLKNNPAPYILDYSQHFRSAFLNYLQSKYSLDQLNKHYQTNYQSFADIPLPQPLWAQQLDLRPSWLDFQEYKTIIASKFKAEQFAIMRQLDPNRYIISWGLRRGPLDLFIDPLKKYRIIFNVSIFGKLGNNHLAYLARQHGVSCINEDYMDQLYIKRYMKDAVIYQSLTSGAIGHVGMRAWFNTGVYTKNGIFERWKPIFKKLTPNEPVKPHIGLISSFCTQLCRDKTFRNSYYPLGNKNYNTGEALIKTVEYSGLAYDWSSDYTAKKIPAYRLLIDTNSIVLTDDYIAKLADYVTAGGHLVLFADSGQFSPANNSHLNPFPLLKQLSFPVHQLTTTTAPVKLAQTESSWNKLKGLTLHDHCIVTGKLSDRFKILAQNNQGRPLLIEWQYGNGKIILFTGIVDWQPPFNHKVLTALQKWADIQAPITIINGKNICSTLLKKGNKYYGVFYNNTKKPQQLTIKFNNLDNQYIVSKELFTNKALAVSSQSPLQTELTIPEKSTRIVELSAPTKQVRSN